MWRWAVLIGISLAGYGCGLGESGASEAVVRDSAGVTIVETRATNSSPVPWTIGDEKLRVGVQDGDPAYLLDRVVGALLLDSARVVVADGGSSQVRIYGLDGSLISAQGREGEGPGEYIYMRGMDPCGDEGFVVFDLNWQLNRYAADGSFLSRRRLETPNGRTPYNLACDGQGRFAMIGWGDEMGSRRVGLYSVSDELLVMDSSGTVLADYGPWLASERIGDQGGSGPHPFGRATVFDLWDGRLFVGTGEAFEVQVRDLSGDLLRIIRGPSLDLQVTDSLVALWLETQLADAPPDLEPAIRRSARDLPLTEGRPAFVALRVDQEGVVWAEQFTVGPDEPQVWSLLDPERGYLGDLTLPVGHELLEAGADYLLTLSRDAVGVERVHLFELVRGA